MEWIQCLLNPENPYFLLNASKLLSKVKSINSDISSTRGWLTRPLAKGRCWERCFLSCCSFSVFFFTSLKPTVIVMRWWEWRGNAVLHFSCSDSTILITTLEAECYRILISCVVKPEVLVRSIINIVTFGDTFNLPDPWFLHHHEPEYFSHKVVFRTRLNSAGKLSGTLTLTHSTQHLPSYCCTQTLSRVRFGCNTCYLRFLGVVSKLLAVLCEI